MVKISKSELYQLGEKVEFVRKSISMNMEKEQLVKQKKTNISI